LFRSPSSFGDAVTFLASVSSGVSTATGTVTFKYGNSSIGSGSVNSSGQATFSTANLSVGSHQITAEYGGDTTHATSASDALTQVVNRATPGTVLSSSLNPSVYGSSVTLTVKVNPSAATGAVEITDGTSKLATLTLSNGTASFTTFTLNAGTYNLVAVYSGDGNFTGSASAPLALVVNPAPLTITADNKSRLLDSPIHHLPRPIPDSFSAKAPEC